MDSAALLDLLGNENRRRILQLLSRKPCYVTEISEYLGVSPKAVIDHLSKLEEAGIVESHTDDRQRKYFHIDRNLRLEVNVSPYSFGTKSAYPASRSLDITTWRYLSVELDVEDRTDQPEKLAAEVDRLKQLENELSMAQRWVQGRSTELFERLTEELDEDFEYDGRLYTDILVSIVEEPRSVPEIAESIDAPPGVVEDALLTMAERGYVDRRGDGWIVTE